MFFRKCFCFHPSSLYQTDAYTDTPPFRIEPSQQWVRVIDVYDGDTMTCILKLHMKYPYRFQIRLSGIDACEMRSRNPVLKAKALEARQCVLQEVTRCSDATLQTLQTRNEIKAFLNKTPSFVWLHATSFDKYGRVLANVYLNKPKTLSKSSAKISTPPQSLSDVLIDRGLAFPYDGHAKLSEEAQCERFTSPG
jgi:endonuclease YncB( thermonuclease family)